MAASKETMRSRLKKIDGRLASGTIDLILDWNPNGDVELGLYRIKGPALDHFVQRLRKTLSSSDLNSEEAEKQVHEVLGLLNSTQEHLTAQELIGCGCLHT